MKNLNEMSSKELKEIGKQLGVKNWWSAKKEYLIEEIEKLQNASDEERAEAIENEEKEKTAVAEYTANWTKYTKRYNVKEFLEGWRSGKIVLESEKKDAPEVVTPAPEPKPLPVVKPAPIVKHVEEPEDEEPELEDEEREPVIFTDEDGLEWEDLDAEEENKKKKKSADTPKNENSLTPKRGALIEWNGKSQTICKWGEELNISPNTLYGRIYKMGWSIEKAFTTRPR